MHYLPGIALVFLVFCSAAAESVSSGGTTPPKHAFSISARTGRMESTATASSMAVKQFDSRKRKEVLSCLVMI
jgi:hypothetical protein